MDEVLSAAFYRECKRSPLMVCYRVACHEAGKCHHAYLASEAKTARSALSEEMLVIEQQERNLHDIVEIATGLLASLDPDTLNPEQFNAWHDLADRIGYSDQLASPSIGGGVLGD